MIAALLPVWLGPSVGGAALVASVVLSWFEARARKRDFARLAAERKREIAALRAEVLGEEG